MKYVSACDMVFSQNNNQRCGQTRAVKTKSNSTATRSHKISPLHCSLEQRHPGGNLNYVPGARSSRRLDKVVIVTPTVPVSLQWLHASLAVRISVFLHKEHCDKRFRDDLLGNVKGFILSPSVGGPALCILHINMCVCVYKTWKYCHLVIESSTVVFLPFIRYLHIPWNTSILHIALKGCFTIQHYIYRFYTISFSPLLVFCPKLPMEMVLSIGPAL